MLDNRRGFTSRRIGVLLVLALMGLLALSPTGIRASYHTPGKEKAPSVTVEDQSIVDGTVTVAEVVAAQDGWMVIHAQKDGGIGPVVGHAAVTAGVNENVVVEIDTEMATDTLYAMLHVDEGEAGVYEFPGPDKPVIVDGKPLSPPFQVVKAPKEHMPKAMGEQGAGPMMPGPVQIYQVMNTSYLMETAGLHALDERLHDTEGEIGPGDAALAHRVRRLVLVTDWPDAFAGGADHFVDVLSDLAAALEDGDLDAAAELAATAHAMQHDLSRDIGLWIDSLFTIEPSVTVEDQPIVDGTVTVAEVVAPRDGWMVIHAQKDGGIGPVIGHAPVVKGTNTDVAVEIDVERATDTLYAMLHVDKGEAGAYEFPGPDGPVIVDGKPVSPPFSVLGGESQSGAAGGETAVTIQSFSFGQPLTVPAGTTVTWTNMDSARHTVTSADGLFDSGDLRKGDRFSFTFDEPGEYSYYCRYHGTADGTGMASTVVVK